VVLWRISNYTTLDGTGGLFASGRWHTRGRPVVYCTENPSTALLEILVHLEIDAEDRPQNFRVLKVEGPDNVSTIAVDPADLPKDWKENLLLTQSVGDRWLIERKSALLRVPSALVPETWNLLVNPAHPEASALRISATYEQAFDSRFFR
jgi:RES domain-containing protein